MIEQFNIGMEFASLLFLAVLFITTLLRKKRSKSSACLLPVMLLSMLLFVSDIIECSSIILAKPLWITNLFLSLDYILTCSVTVYFHLFWLAFMEEKEGPDLSRFSRLFVFPASGACIFFYLINFWTGLLFTMTEGGTPLYTPLFIPTQLVTFSIIWVDVVAALRHCKDLLLPQRISIFLYAVLPLLGDILDLTLDTTFVYIFIGLIACIALINMTIEQDTTVLQQEMLLSDIRMQALQLQMNPHFIYNTLGSISALCRKEPQLASYYISVFSKYLRNNFGELANRPVVSFQEEIDHLELYLSIEQLRFPDMVVERRFSSTDFLLPSLTVQPLVENAIKHGIRNRPSGGTLILASFETVEAYIIRIRDDGIGFEQIPDDGKQHIGIQNVRTRLKLLCNGELNIVSVPGVGTTAEITIWKESQS